MSYHSREQSKVVGITDLKDKHFAEKVRRYLDNRKYGYDYSRKGVSITSLPETAEAKLSFLLRNSLGLDNQVDAYDFACFINAFSSIDGFDAMPWITRTAIFNHHYHNNVSKPTLERWHHHLVEGGNIAYTVREGHIHINPTAGIKNVKQPKVKIITFSELEIRRMLNYYHGRDYLSTRNRTMIALFFDTGMRLNEVMTLCPEQIRDDHILVHGKGNDQVIKLAQRSGVLSNL